MAHSDWRPVGTVDLAVLSEARLQAHYAVQWLARAARAYIPANHGDGHTSMEWNEELDGFTTHALPGGGHLALSVSALTLVLVDADGRPGPSLSLPGHSDAEARAWLGNQMQALALDPLGLDGASPWEMPAHPIGTGAPYTGGDLAPARKDLAAWFANADRSLRRVRDGQIANKRMVSPVRCWPHHFDIAALISLDGDPESARSVNAGLSPGDRSYDEPYLYVSPWPYPDAGKLPPLPTLGHWHTQGYLAAVAPASRITAAASPQQAAEEFLAAAVAAAADALR